VIGVRVAIVAVTAASVVPSALAGAYDPLARGAAPTRVDLVVQDDARRRTIPLRVYLPEATGGAPVVLFSHGLGGSRENNPYLGEHWGARSYVVVFLQHAGSDESVWKDAPVRERRGAMEEAASARNFVLRVEDVRAVLNQLARWNRAAGHPLSGRLDLSRVGMSGHSFGAVTTQAVSGQSFARAGTRFTDDRIRAALAMSPSAPRRGDAKAALPGAALGPRGARPLSAQVPWLARRAARVGRAHAAWRIRHDALVADAARTGSR
jgi:dienelactone hydrolase